MAKKSIIAREQRKHVLAGKFKKRREALKKLIKSSTSFDEIMEAQTKLSKLPINSSLSRCSTRCKQCGRSHAIYKKFGLCRICLRQQLMNGNVTGGRKSSW